MAGTKTQIFRQSKTNNYSIIHNEILRRNDISWKAKGIMCYVLSLPDDWVIYLEELIEHATDKKASFRSGWNELTEKGYVRRFPVRNESGKIVEWKTEIRENVDLTVISPLTDFQEVENQEVENQEVENQEVENRKLLNTYSFTNNLSKLNTDKEEVVTSSREYSNEHFRLAAKLKNNLINDFSKEMVKVNLEKWADIIRLMEEKDSYTLEQIEDIINWLPSNDFWFGNIRSAKKLRDKFESLRFETKKEKSNKTSRSKQLIREEDLPDRFIHPEPELEITTERQAEIEARVKAYLEKKSLTSS